jgi:ferric-dicitrate binding protein FerR (iron transport regulator)
MQLSETVIHQFLSGNLSVKEAKEVVQLLEQHPEWVDQYFSADEWNNLQVTQQLSKQQLQQKFETIKPNIQIPAQKRHAKLIRMVVTATSVAAAVIMLFYTGKWLFNNSNMADGNTTIASLTIDTVTQKNTTDTIQYLALEDGSSIQLSPNSTVTFVKHFPNNKRQIQLMGTAFFDVAKDKNRPFEVQAAGFSTIALGTSFRIIAAQNSNLLTVQLYTGKVVIKQTDNAANFKNVFLVPNQQLVLNTNNLNTSISRINTNVNKTTLADNTTAKPALTWDDYITETQLQFTNTPLTDVFNVLEHQYGISIKYNPATIKGMVFTGTFKKSDEAQNMLSTITTINKLTLLKSGNTHFKITKD